MLLAECMQQHAASFVVADDAHGKDSHTQIGQVVNSVAGAAGDHRAVTMAQDEHWRFTGDARNFAIDKFVGNQVTQDGDAELGKLLNDFDKAVGRFLGFLHGLSRFSHAGARICWPDRCSMVFRSSMSACCGDSSSMRSCAVRSGARCEESLPRLIRSFSVVMNQSAFVCFFRASRRSMSDCW